MFVIRAHCPAIASDPVAVQAANVALSPSRFLFFASRRNDLMSYGFDIKIFMGNSSRSLICHNFRTGNRMESMIDCFTGIKMVANG